MAHFVYNISTDTYNSETLINNDPWGYLLAPNNATPQLVRLARRVRGEGRSLLADNGNFETIGRVARAFKEDREKLREQLARVEEGLGRSARPGELPAPLSRQYFHASVRARELARQLAGDGERRIGEQLALEPTHIIGVEDITAACWLALDLERTYMGRRRRDWSRMNSATARRAIRRLGHLPASLRDAYYPVASAESYATADDAGRIFATKGLTHVAMGFGAYMVDNNYTDHVYLARRRVDFGSRLPNRYIRTVAVARGFHHGYESVTGNSPDGFHFLGLGAPIMLPLVALAVHPGSCLTFDATSPIRDALKDGMLYVTKPAYLKIRIRKSAGWLADDPARRWDCPCPFCKDFTKRYPFDYSAGVRWRQANLVSDPSAADLREGGGLYDAYPLYSEPSSGPRRDAVDRARVGHNHWALEQVTRAIREAIQENSLPQHVEQVVSSYAPTTSPPYANAVIRGLELATARH